MYKLGIDVGGTNTDAVLIDENRNVVADIKYPTSADIYDGILGAVRTVLEVSGVDRTQIHQAMLGTTQCTNAIVERKNLAPIGILRIGAPATTGIRPMVDWAEDIKKIVVGSVIVGGGMFGVLGLILGTPIYAVIYALVGKRVKNKIDSKGRIAQEALDFEVLNYTKIAAEQKKLREEKEMQHREKIMKFINRNKTNDEDESSDNTNE